MVDHLLTQIRACRACKDVLSHEPRPVLNFSSASKIVIVGQAPGLKVHKTGIPWNDASGERLRAWLGVTKQQFYNEQVFGIVPMGFCYPGKAKSGDLPPRPECAKLWMQPILETLENRRLLILIGKYAQDYFLKDKKKATLTETVRAWKSYLPEYIVLPHPSPRNNIWLKKHEWFEQDVVPEVRRRVKKILSVS